MTFALLPWILQSVVLGHVFVLLMVCLGFGHKPYYIRGVLASEWRQNFHWASWLALSLVLVGLGLWAGLTRSWWYLGAVAALAAVLVPFLAIAPKRFSTTIGHGMMLHHRASDNTVEHELVHVRQYEDLALLGTVLAAGLWPWLGWEGSLAMWASAGAPWLLMNFISGWIRDGNPYLGAEHEKSAYAQTR